MLTCLDCFNCKLVLPINKEDLFSTPIFPQMIKPRIGKNNKIKCSKGIWEANRFKNKNNNPHVFVEYHHMNIQRAMEGNSRYLNLNKNCEFFDVEDEL